MRAVFRGAWITALAVVLSGCQFFGDDKDGRAMEGVWPHVNEFEGLWADNGQPRTARSIYTEVADLATAAGHTTIADLATKRYQYQISWTPDAPRGASTQYSYAQAILALRLATQGHWDSSSAPLGVKQLLEAGGFHDELQQDWGAVAHTFGFTADWYLDQVEALVNDDPPGGAGGYWKAEINPEIWRVRGLSDAPSMGSAGDPWNAIRFGRAVSAYYACVAQEWDDCNNELEHVN